MVAEFSTPILSVAAEAVRDLDGRDALSGLWTIFTKCKGSLQHGPRLENLTWRLWHREMKASEFNHGQEFSEKDRLLSESSIHDEKAAYRPPTRSDTVSPPTPYPAPPADGAPPTPPGQDPSPSEGSTTTADSQDAPPLSPSPSPLLSPSIPARLSGSSSRRSSFVGGTPRSVGKIICELLPGARPSLSTVSSDSSRGIADLSLYEGLSRKASGASSASSDVHHAAVRLAPSFQMTPVTIPASDGVRPTSIALPDPSGSAPPNAISCLPTPEMEVGELTSNLICDSPPTTARPSSASSTLQQSLSSLPLSASSEHTAANAPAPALLSSSPQQLLSGLPAPPPLSLSEPCARSQVSEVGNPSSHPTTSQQTASFAQPYRPHTPTAIPAFEQNPNHFLLPQPPRLVVVNPTPNPTPHPTPPTTPLITGIVGTSTVNKQQWLAPPGSPNVSLRHSQRTSTVEENALPVLVLSPSGLSAEVGSTGPVTEAVYDRSPMAQTGSRLTGDNTHRPTTASSTLALSTTTTGSMSADGQPSLVGDGGARESTKKLAYLPSVVEREQQPPRQGKPSRGTGGHSLSSISEFSATTSNRSSTSGFTTFSSGFSSDIDPSQKMATQPTFDPLRVDPPSTNLKRLGSLSTVQSLSTLVDHDHPFEAVQPSPLPDTSTATQSAGTTSARKRKPRPVSSGSSAVISHSRSAGRSSSRSRSTGEGTMAGSRSRSREHTASGSNAALTGLGGLTSLGMTIAAVYPPPVATRKQMAVGGKGRKVMLGRGVGGKARGVVRRNSAGPGIDVTGGAVGVAAPESVPEVTESDVQKAEAARLEEVEREAAVQRQMNLIALERLEKRLTRERLEKQRAFERLENQKALERLLNPAVEYFPVGNLQRSPEPQTLSVHQESGKQGEEQAKLEPLEKHGEILGSAVDPGAVPGSSTRPPGFIDMRRYEELVADENAKYARFNIGSNSDGSGVGSKSAGSGSSFSGGPIFPRPLHKDAEAIENLRLRSQQALRMEDRRANAQLAVGEGQVESRLVEVQEKQRRQEEEVRQEVARQQRLLEENKFREFQEQARLRALDPERQLTTPEVPQLHHLHQQHLKSMKPLSRQASETQVGRASEKVSEKAKGKAKAMDSSPKDVPAAPTSKQAAKNKSKSTPNLASLDPDLAARVLDSLAEPLLPKGRMVVVATESEYETDSDDGSWSSADATDEADAQKQEQYKRELAAQEQREQEAQLEAQRLQNEALLREQYLRQQQQQQAQQNPRASGVQRTNSSHYPGANNTRNARAAAQRVRQQQQQARDLAVHLAKLDQAAKEAQRQRDIIKKLPTESFQDLAKARANSVGLLSQLLNPNPEIFPPTHPYRRGFSSGAIKPAGLTPMAPMQATTSEPGPSVPGPTRRSTAPPAAPATSTVAPPQPQVTNTAVSPPRPQLPDPAVAPALPTQQRDAATSQSIVAGVRLSHTPRRHASTDEGKRRAPSRSGTSSSTRPQLPVTKSSAALPVASQILVGSVANKATPSAALPSGMMDNRLMTGSGGYRPKGPPQGQEMEDDSGDDAETGQIRVSESVAEQKLKAWAQKGGVRVHQHAPQTQAGPSRHQHPDEDVPEWARVSQPRPPSQNRRSMNGLQFTPMLPPPPPTKPIPLNHPYNLPPPDLPTTPRTTRRRMLGTELSESLRRNVLWERQVSKTDVAGMKRSTSSGGLRRSALSDLQPVTAFQRVVKLHAKGTVPTEDGDPSKQIDGILATDGEVDEMRKHAMSRNRSWANNYHFAGR